jgi:ppGpp synthetase/RelA/SpoT-type nucleotidyltranferase
VSYIKARPVEIQLRTLLQHQWASYVEALGDRWGRELRYGEAIQAPTPELAAVREEVVKDLESLSTTMISRVEEAADVLWPLRASRLALDSQKWSPEVLEERMAQAREIEPTVERGRQAVVRMLESIISRAEGIGSTIQ